jgi:3-hydroxyacyl-[acyl-carrier-protein] dehydratase
MPDNGATLIAPGRVTQTDDSGITIEKAVLGDEFFFVGHFPTCPVYPGVFIIEGVNQAVEYYTAARHVRPRILEVRSARFLDPVLPGDLLECDCRCTLIPEIRRLQVDATCYSRRRKAATVKLVYRLEEVGGPRPC